MNFFKRLLPGHKKNEFSYQLILDIGTEYIKAAIIEFNNQERHILGYGRTKQSYGNMDGGAITDISGIVKIADQAIAKAISFTPYRPTSMVCGMAGEFIKGILITLHKNREYPEKQINRREIKDLIHQGEKQALKQAVEKTGRETGIKKPQLDLLNYSLVEIKVDGYKINNPYQFQGTNLDITLFYSFAPLVQLGAMRTVANQLGYQLSSVVAEPYAIATSIMSTDSYEFGAIIIDIGGGTTDIALIRNGGIEGTRMFAMGGRAFTRTLASNLDISLHQAEELKMSYSENREIRNERRVEMLLKSDMHILYQGIELSLQELARGEALPRKIYFCGGGSGLRGLVDGFKQINLVERLPFIKEPEIRLLCGEDIKGIKDETNLLTAVEHTTPRSLSYFGTLTAKTERRLINFDS